MKLTYGKSYCTLNYSTENVRNVLIKYRGRITIKHSYMEYLKSFKNVGYFKNFGKKSLIIHNHNEIKIGYNEDVIGDIELFRWVGEFKILSCEVNGKKIGVSATNIDYWNLITSTWDSAGKPEQYKGEYRFGRSPRKRKLRRRRSTTSKPSSISTTTRTITGSSGGGY